jgi:outer membrane lipoprotein-sorting protein
MQSRRCGLTISPALILILMSLAAYATCPIAGAQEPAGADAVLATIDKILALDSYASTVTMETKDAGGAVRSMTFETLSRRDKGSYLEVTAPARTKGTRFLQLEGSLWMYNPKSGSSSALRLSARDSFQGSTFSNADVGKTRFADDYSPRLAPGATLDHVELGTVACIVIESVAKTDEAAYGKIMMWARKIDSMPLRMEYYAKSGLLFKRMELSLIRDFGGFTRPSVLRMESIEKKGTVTTLTIKSIERRDVPLSVFGKIYLTR